MDIAHFIFGILGDASGLFLFLAPTITFKRIIMNKSTEKFSGIPYNMTLLNCLLSAWYGLPFVSPHNILVTVINGTGAVIEIIYVLIFLFFAPKKEKAKTLGLFSFVVAVFSAVVFISLFALHGNSRKIFCGFAAAIFSIIMYGSPLSIMDSDLLQRLHRAAAAAAHLIVHFGEREKDDTAAERMDEWLYRAAAIDDPICCSTYYKIDIYVRLVIKSKSVEFMPFFLSLFVFICGTSWFIFGLLGRDPFVAVPNGVGSALGTVQLILYFIYRDDKKGGPKKPTTGTHEESMEMGTAKSEVIQSNDNN